MGSTSEKIVIKGGCGKNDGYVYFRSQLLSTTEIREAALYPDGLSLEIFQPTGRHDVEGDEIWEYKGRQLLMSSVIAQAVQRT